MTKCPRCGLINPETSQRCDCGYDFGTGTVDKTVAPPPSAASRLLKSGLMTCGIGIVGIIAGVALRGVGPNLERGMTLPLVTGVLIGVVCVPIGLLICVAAAVLKR